MESNSDVRHEGLSLTMEGSVNLQLSSKNVGIFEAFSNSIKVKFYSSYFIVIFGKASCMCDPSIQSSQLMNILDHLHICLLDDVLTSNARGLQLQNSMYERQE